MNEELLRLRRTMVLSSLMILVGAVDLALFLFKGIKVIHPFLDLVLVVVGFFIFKAAFKKEDKKTEEPKKDRWEGWEYLGNHQGMNGRPANYVLEKNGCLPFYSHYDKSFTRRLVKEITAANVVSISRIPLLLTSFAVARDNPWLLSSLLATIFALDAVDGSLARKGFGNSSAGPHIDILSDHIVEFITVFEFAYNLNAIPHEVPWILAARDAVTDFMRLYNAVFLSNDATSAHPHASFGTFDKVGRVMSFGVKTVEAVTVPIIPSLGIYLSTAHVLTSLYRGLPVITSDKSKKIYKHILERLKNR